MTSAQADENSANAQSRTAKRDANGRLKAVIDDSSPSQSSVARNHIVRWNVGGVRYEASRDTLMRYKESMLASLVSGK